MRAVPSSPPRIKLVVEGTGFALSRHKMTRNNVDNSQVQSNLRTISEYNADLRLMRLPEVLILVGVGKTNLYALISRGDFPKQTKISASCVGWPKGAVYGWLAAKQQAA